MNKIYRVGYRVKKNSKWEGIVFAIIVFIGTIFIAGSSNRSYTTQDNIFVLGLSFFMSVLSFFIWAILFYEEGEYVIYGE